MTNCPKCNTSWLGEPIPEDIRHHYSGTHWERQIGIDGGYMDIYDGTVALRCPDCGHECPVNDSKWAKEMFNKYIEATKCEIPEYAFKCDNCTCEDE